MLDNFDNTTSLVSEPVVDSDGMSSKYDAILSSQSVRTNNVLAALQQKYDNKQAFLNAFITMSRKEIRSLKNCGAKTVDEILAIQSFINTTRDGQDSDAPVFTSRSLPSNIDTLIPLVMPRLDGLSVRAKHGIIFFLEENHNSLSEMYAAFTNPKFKPVKMKNVGRGTSAEVMGALNDIRGFLESFDDEQSIDDAVNKFFSKTLDVLQIPSYAQDGILKLENTLGHFPLFAALKAYFEGLEGEERSIIDGLFITREGQIPREREEVAAELGLSPERVRQNLQGRIMDIEKANVFKKYSEKVGEIFTGEIYQTWSREVLLLDEDGNELHIPKEEQIPGERFKKNDTVRAIIKKVEMRNNTTPYITLSRIDPDFLARLFEMEVPEIADGLITIKKVVRVPGERAKVAVESYDERIDPIGACIGVKGGRVIGIVRELGNENIDVLQWSSNPKLLIQRALTPARVSSIDMGEGPDDKVKVYMLPEEVQKGIGRGGVNVQLNVMEPVIAESILESVTWLCNVIDTLRVKCIEGITVNADHCYEMVKNSIGIVTALNPYIGYKASSKVAKEALETGGSVYDLVLEHGLMTKEKLDEALDPRAMTSSHEFLK